jgi:hypothetical protein
MINKNKHKPFKERVLEVKELLCCFKTRQNYVDELSAKKDLKLSDREKMMFDWQFDDIKGWIPTAKMEKLGNEIRGELINASFIIQNNPEDETADQFIVSIKRTDGKDGSGEFALKYAEMQKMLKLIAADEEDDQPSKHEVDDKTERRLRGATGQVVRDMLQQDQNQLMKSVVPKIKALREIYAYMSVPNFPVLESIEKIYPNEAEDCTLDDLELTPEMKQLAYKIIFNLIQTTKQSNTELPEQICKLREISHNFGRKYKKHPRPALRPYQTLKPEELVEIMHGIKIKRTLFGSKLEKLNEIKDGK